MSEDCLAERAAPLIAATSRERLQLLAGRVREISAEMNARGILDSSIHVNAVASACAEELHKIAEAFWECVKRAHESCGRDRKEKVLPYYQLVLTAEGEKIDALLRESMRTVAAGRQNKAMVPMQEVRDAQEHLAAKYAAEIAIYLANLNRSEGSTLERWSNRLKDNKLLAFAALVVAGVVAVASFSEALEKIGASLRSLLGGG